MAVDERAKLSQMTEGDSPNLGPSISREFDIAYWENCQTRVTSYLTTNGQIAITICGLYATSISVIVTLGSGPDGTDRPLVYSLVIPAFSVFAMTLGIRIYVWIKEQLEYSALAGLHPRYHKELLSFEEWRTQCCMEWESLTWWERLRLGFTSSLVIYSTLPFRLRDIYMYYFLIYALTPLVATTYAVTIGSSIWVPILWLLVNFAFFAGGYSELVRYQLARDRVTSLMIGNTAAPRRYNLKD